jgi:hypothetical protein
MNIILHKHNNFDITPPNSMVEMDLRNNIVAHDLHEMGMELSTYLRRAKDLNLQLIAVNIKSDGNEKNTVFQLERYGVPYFLMDMSRHTMMEYFKYTKNIALPVNEVDTVEQLGRLPATDWVWLVTFYHDTTGQMKNYQEILQKYPNRKIAIVSPDLHNNRRDNSYVLNIVKQQNERDQARTYVCTDYPGDYDD